MHREISAPARFAALVCFAAACTPTSGSPIDDGPSSPSDDAGTLEPTPDGAAPLGPPAWAIVTQVFSPEGETSYLVVADDVTQTRAIDLSTAIEYPGRGVGATLPGSGALFVGGTEGGTVSRYDLTPGGFTLVPGPTVSFANEGVTSFVEYGEQLQIVSPTKAYWFDGRSAQIIVWNPSTMSVLRAIPLPQLVVPNALLTFSTNVVRRGTSIYYPLGWRSDSEARIVSRASVLVIDTGTDEVRVLDDDRCGYVRTSVTGPDGRLYLATEAYGSAVHRVVPQNAPAPCLLRLDASWSGFDPDYYVDLGAVFGGATAGNLVPGHDASRSWIRVLDEGTTTIGPATNPRILASTPAWSWWTIVPGDVPTVAAAPLGVGNGSDFLLNVSDHPLIPEFAIDRSHTVLRDMASGSPGATTLTVPGLVFSLGRLR